MPVKEGWARADDMAVVAARIARKARRGMRWLLVAAQAGRCARSAPQGAGGRGAVQRSLSPKGDARALGRASGDSLLNGGSRGQEKSVAFGRRQAKLLGM